MTFIFHKGNLLLTLVLVSRWCADYASAAEPEILWSQTLSNGGTIEGEGLLKGNGVVLSEDEQSLWVATDSGRISVLEASSGTLLSSFRPQQIEGHYIESRSSVALYQPSTSVVFAVYAVVDVPESHGHEHGVTAANDISSRIIALNSGSTNDIGTIRWSTPIMGVVEGTPVISSDGERIYVTSNTALHGILTVLDGSSGSLVSQTIDPKPMTHYGPLSMVTNNGIDKLFWVDATDRGYATRGRVHVVVSDFLSAVHSQRSFESSSTVAPTLSSDGKRIWIGGRSATVHGWDDSSLKPIWSTQLNPSNRNESYPIVNTIETDDGQSRLFVASASNSLHCIDAQNGNVLWTTNSTASVFMTGVKYSAEHNFVYSIEHLSGAVSQHDADTGVIHWRIGCENVTMNPICQASVEADFSVASDGLTVFHGDVYGRITSVKFSATPPTESPSAVPSETPTDAPTRMPSPWPSGAPSASPSSEPSTSPSSMPSDEPSLMPSFSGQPSSVPSSFPSLHPSTEPSGSPSSEPSTMPSTAPSSSSAPSIPKETRGNRDPPTTGNDPKPWEPDDSRFVRQTSAARGQRAWVSTLVIVLSSAVWL